MRIEVDADRLHSLYTEVVENKERITNLEEQVNVFHKYLENFNSRLEMLADLAHTALKPVVNLEELWTKKYLTGLKEKP